MSTLLRFVFFAGDLVFLNISILWASSFGQSSTADKAYLLVFSNLAWLFLLLVSNPYRVDKGWSVNQLLKNQLAFIFIHLVVVCSLIFFFRRTYSVGQVAAIYALFTPLFFLWKVCTYYLRKLLSPDLPFKNYVIIGRGEDAARVRKFYLTNPQLGYRFKRYFDPGALEDGSETISSYCVAEDVHEILYCVPSPGQEALTNLVKFGLNSLIKVTLVIEPMTSQGQGIQFDAIGGAPVVDIAVLPLDEASNILAKRIFDLVFSFLFLVFVMSWLLPILFVIIKLDSPGPLFFKQPRSGKGNRTFQCLKFRTMIVNHMADTLQATPTDNRITRVGRVLRKTSLDELPQFFNVFLGSMSVVGPRPHMLKHTEEYSKLIEQFMGRHYIKPGVTGLAQCMGYRGETRTLSDMQNRVRLDRYYIENWSFGLDMKIIFLTIVGLIRGSDKAF